MATIANRKAAYKRAKAAREAAEITAAAAWADVEAAEKLLDETRKLAHMYNRQLASRKSEQAAAHIALMRAEAMR